MTRIGRSPRFETSDADFVQCSVFLSNNKSRIISVLLSLHTCEGHQKEEDECGLYRTCRVLSFFVLPGVMQLLC